MLNDVRVIAGNYRSRTLQAPVGMATRPTSDRLRETLFNVLAPQIEDAVFLDLYSGSGAVGIEAISRGARHVAFVERAPAAIKSLRANLISLKITDGFSVSTGSISAFLRRPEVNMRFDLVFLDPPYDLVDEYETTLAFLGGTTCAILAPDATVIAEHRRKHRLEDRYGQLSRYRLLEQGDAALSFYRASRATLDEKVSS